VCVRAVTKSAVTLTVIGFCVLSSSGPALAKNAPGAPHWCKHHPTSNRPACQKVGGSGGPPPATTITVSPNPIVETGNSDVYAVVSVASDPVYAEQTVEFVSGLNGRCGQGVTWITNQGTFSGSTATATLDNDGNASVIVLGGSCAAGSVQVIALVEAGTDPTGLTTFTIEPPAPIL